jgi:hypothetical protein
MAERAEYKSVRGPREAEAHFKTTIVFLFLWHFPALLFAFWSEIQQQWRHHISDTMRGWR